MENRWGSFDEFFSHATRSNRLSTSKIPFEFQRTLATGSTLPNLVRVPTGSGKTLAVVLAWIWRRFFHPDPRVRAATPRRLVYALPMRVLVEQTVSEVDRVLDNLGMLQKGGVALRGQDEHSDQLSGHKISVHTLMGGEPTRGWFLYPADHSVLVGTQDMLLSGALNRAYGSSRYRWPQLFALLNNDTLWVADEIQLMDVGLVTSTQLQAFRDTFDTFGPSKTIWMSATASPTWLGTVDHPVPSESQVLTLTSSDLSNSELKTRLHAPKTLHFHRPAAGAGQPAYPRQLAEWVREQHRPGSLTLVVLNTVERARSTYTALAKLYRKDKRAEMGPSLTLLHSRFRPPERRYKLEALGRGPGSEDRDQIVVTTQVVEAGVDVSAATLVTELAPWTSLVQRFGRCNRYGTISSGAVTVVDVDEKHTAPYDSDVMSASRQIVQSLDGRSVAPADLPAGDLEQRQSGDVIRRKDLLDLFDTSPDLTGNDLDVSRYIRQLDETDAQVFWRDWGEASRPPSGDEFKSPSAEELCSVPLTDLRKAVKEESLPVWTWDHLNERWQKSKQSDLLPGRIFVIPSAAGGYSEESGWGLDQRGVHVPPHYDHGTAGAGEEGLHHERQSFHSTWLTVADHTDHVCEQLEVLLSQLGDGLRPELVEALRLAARHHDRGKSHEIFQARITEVDSPNPPPALAPDQAWAKSPSSAGERRPRRPFRHELASALAVLQESGNPPTFTSALAAYLCAAHHGRVRMSIRTFPNDQAEDYPPGVRIALGVVEGHELPQVDLGGGFLAPPITLTLEPMELGGSTTSPSWSEQALTLLKRLGPFRLAWLEALLRSADVVASKKEAVGESIHYEGRAEGPALAERSVSA